ncbi:Malonyl CoA-acyl carrier protein transacylase [Galdieria sulphuraria]|uniref:[acyl-carrier-protein] S-malonyltransferase n=1 Tax=Galdieria sulphuraria TaxID=130081 RepID=M2W9W9_GALSU|nr:[acyl-carrier-protein] S-malonyltransferase [Galdieria sulphuraria]EME32706.1 [acyl-carrier-protein] S-malonyltransferase [Galdieria sulphuraria]GJD07907.1 Malonyl CoA-acyl carrier protein transacylase [Galdieria sulphuraria]|eukprot:XP_005709226.1 [acyl-carrier-protein] S-malonyltransferase [Galdieria sulphuraria]
MNKTKPRFSFLSPISVSKTCSGKLYQFRFLKQQITKLARRRTEYYGFKKVERRLSNVQASARPTVVLCPGQGAQYAGMGKLWIEKSLSAKELFEEADDLLSSCFPQSISEICCDGPKETLDRTDVAQPAIFLVSYISWISSQEVKLVSKEAISFSALAGLSLGEYTALVLGGALLWQDALRLVQIRGKAMQEASERTKGGMVALMGCSEQQAWECCSAVRQGQVLIPANFNSPGQVVLSGHLEACQRAIEYATSKMQLKATPLSVAGAFHSPLMESASDTLSKALEQVDIQSPNYPVLCNVTGRPHNESPNSIRHRLTEQLTSPVRWADCMKYIETNFSEEQNWLELAPGKTLAGLLRRINRKWMASSLDEIGNATVMK